MNFFASIFSDDDPPPDDHPNSPPQPDSPVATIPYPNPNPNPWNFGSLLKTIATRSESVIQTCRRDIDEFRFELLKETALIRDVATRAVKDFPDTIDAGASVAQESLESVGQAIDSLGSSVCEGTAKIIARSKELHLFDDDNGNDEDDDDDAHGGWNRSGNHGSRFADMGLSVVKYSRFEMRLREIQGDRRTYEVEPDDSEEYRGWKSGFLMEDNGEEIESLMAENRLVEGMYVELVPGSIHRETFWSRYFYRAYKLRQAEEARERIVKRAISGEDEEDLSWDFDDAEERRHHGQEGTESNAGDGGELSLILTEGSSCTEVAQASTSVENASQMVVEQRASDVSAPSGDVHLLVEVDEGVVSEGKNERGESCKDSDISIVSSQPSLGGEEELGWDEIEDMGSEDDGRKTAEGKTSNASDLRKRLSVAEEDEDLCWDIEDDDEPINS